MSETSREEWKQSLKAARIEKRQIEKNLSDIKDRIRYIEQRLAEPRPRDRANTG